MSEIKGIAERHIERTGHTQFRGSVGFIISELMPDIEEYVKEKVAEALAKDALERDQSGK